MFYRDRISNVARKRIARRFFRPRDLKRSREMTTNNVHVPHGQPVDAARKNYAAAFRNRAQAHLK